MSEVSSEKIVLYKPVFLFSLTGVTVFLKSFFVLYSK